MPFERDAEALGGGLHHAQAFGHDLAAYAVTGDDGDAMGGGHGATPCGIVKKVSCLRLTSNDFNMKIY